MVAHRTFAKQHEAEAAWVVEYHTRLTAGSGRKMENDMVVGGSFGALVLELAGSVDAVGLLDAKRARHAEMADQRWPILDMHGQIFGPAAERADQPAFEALREAFRKGKAQIGPADLDGEDAGAFHRRLQPTPNGLNLGKFRHWRQAWEGMRYRSGRRGGRDVRPPSLRCRRRSA